MLKPISVYALKVIAISVACYLALGFSSLIAFIVFTSRLGWMVLPAVVLGLVAGGLVFVFLKTRYQWVNVLIVAWMPVIVAWLVRGGFVRKATLVYENGVVEPVDQAQLMFGPDYAFLVSVLTISAMSGVATMLALKKCKSRL